MGRGQPHSNAAASRKEGMGPTPGEPPHEMKPPTMEGETEMAGNQDQQTTNPHADCARKEQEILGRINAVKADAEAAVKAARDSAEARVAALANELKAISDQLAKAEKARIDGKRAELATLRKVKPEEIPNADEAVLDAWIGDLKASRGRADGSRIGAAPAAKLDADVKDGIAATPYGYTVVDPKAASAASRNLFGSVN